MGVHAGIKGIYPQQTEMIDHGGALPDPGKTKIVFYMQAREEAPHLALRNLLRTAYRSGLQVDEASVTA